MPESEDQKQQKVPSWEQSMQGTLKRLLGDPNQADRVVVGVSGGIDSMALALLLHRSGYPTQWVHVNHQVQPKVNDEMQLAVQETAKQWGVACTVFVLNPTNTQNKQKQGRGSFEAWARQERLTRFKEHARQSGLKVVALGHHAEEQVETRLLALCRGQGVRSLLGMQQESQEEGLRWIRPLLQCTKAELEHYLCEHGVVWVEDPSNQDTQYTRNRLRHDILPVLKQERSFAALFCADRAMEQELEDLLALRNECADWDMKALVKQVQGEKGLYTIGGGWWSLSTVRQLAVLERLVSQSGQVWRSGALRNTREQLEQRKRQLIKTQKPQTQGESSGWEKGFKIQFSEQGYCFEWEKKENLQRVKRQLK